MFIPWQSLLMPPHYLLEANSKLLGMTFITLHDLALTGFSGLSLIIVSQPHTT